MGTKWTEERKQRQRELIQRTKPWEKSTGPRTAEGKARASLNALKHGLRTAEIEDLKKILHRQRQFINALVEHKE